MKGAAIWYTVSSENVLVFQLGGVNSTYEK